MFDNWFVGEDSHYYYGDSEAEVREENALSPDFNFVSQEKWTAKDYAEIFGNELEDRNRHSFVDMPSWLLDILSKTSLSDSEKAFVMRAFSEKVLREV